MVSERVPLDSPEDVLRLAAEALQQEDYPKPVAGVEFSLKKAYAGVPVGEEHVRRTDLIAACVNSYYWLEQSGGMGQWRFKLTVNGAERLREIQEAHVVERHLPLLGPIGRLNEFLRGLWNRVDVILKLLAWLATAVGAGYWFR